MKKILKPILIMVGIFVIGVILLMPTLKNISYGIDLQGGFEILYRVEPLEEDGVIDQDALTKTYNAITDRIDTLGVSEPVITIEGDNLIRVQLPGISNEEDARSRISTTAILSFRDINDNLLMTSEVLDKGGANAEVNPSIPGTYMVSLKIKDTSKFYEVTRDISKMGNGDNLIITWLDFEEGVDAYTNFGESCGDGNMKCISAAAVSEGLNSNSVTISGNFTKEEAELLAEYINNGSLPTKLVEEATPKSVTATFGEEVIEKTAIAGVITFVLIALMLVVKYRISGVLASICLFAYILFVFIIYNAVGGVLTLTGIAALVLGIGMAVDSIIISNERVNDVLLEEDKLTKAFNSANESSLVAIIDANITTLLAGIILYIFGESSVKGFATMLIITIFITVFTTVFMYRWILGMFVKSKVFDKKEVMLFGKRKKKKRRDFVKFSRWPALISVIVIVVGLMFAVVKGFNFGVDFTGGTNINLSSSEKINFDEIKEIVKDYDLRDYDYYMGSTTEGYIILNDILDDEEELDITTKLNDLGLQTSLNEISNLVTSNLTKNAIKALVYSMLAMVIYVSIRFNFNYALSALLMLVHDVVIILAIFAIFRINFDFIIVAALLTIVGYSINDTIVVFDRMRDTRRQLFGNKKKLTKEELKRIVNISSSDTFSRNVLTSITTIIAVVTLICVGLTDIFTFNIAILIGLIAGAISSLLLGPTFLMYLEKRSMNKPEKEDDFDDGPEELKIKGINS